MRENFPAKNTEDSLETELGYCKELIDTIKKNKTICGYPKVQEKLNLLEESVSDILEHLETSKYKDAKTEHKTADTSFFGYKTHIAMTEERIITAATITSGEKTDGKELPALVRKSLDAGMEVESVIGDKAYSDKKNIEEAKDGGSELIARLNSIVTEGNRSNEDEFEFNLDSGMYLCTGGHLAVHKYLDRHRKEKKNKNPRMVYFFNVENANAANTKKAVIRMAPKRKHTVKL